MSTKLSHLKDEAIKLRLSGKSYGYIKKALGLKSKGTLSYWFKDFKLPPEARKRLERNMTVARERGLFKFNAERTKNIREENEQEYQKGMAIVKNLSAYELLLIGASLYWGEGAKREGRYAKVSLSNSDPILVAIFARFIREILAVPEHRIKGGVQIHPNISEKKAREFWADIIGIKPETFYITRQISSASKGVRPKRFLPYGTAVLNVNSRRLFYRLKGYIRGISSQSGISY